MLQTFDNFASVFFTTRDYCSEDLRQYFECEDDDVIVSIRFTNNSVSGSLSSEQILMLPKRITEIVFSNNKNLDGEFIDWSVFETLNDLEILDLSNNDFSGSVDFVELSGHDENSTSINFTVSSLTRINLGNNKWDEQSVAWEFGEFVPFMQILDLHDNKFVGSIDLQHFVNVNWYIYYFDVSLNKFEGNIDLQYLTSCNIHYLVLSLNKFTGITNFDYIDNIVDLEELYINDNEINDDIDLSWFPNRVLTYIDCHNNSLSGNINIHDLPNTVVDFDCSNNDFGTLTWYITYDDSYKL